MQFNKVDPTCGDADVVCISQGETVTIDLTTTTTFAVSPDSPSITNFTIEFPGIVTDLYNCTTNVFTNCYSVNTGTSAVEYLLEGGPGPCESNGSAGGTCPGVLNPGDGFTVEGIGFPDGATAMVTAPESGSALMLLVGLAGLIAFRKKLSSEASPV
ncbi:MAG: hypothetical protein WA192_12725 [Candidatus Acidiferrales bacterium]